MSVDHGKRKTDHLVICATGDVGFDQQSTLLENVQLVHDSLPELSTSDIDLTTMVFGKKLRAPILIAAMTGGNEEAGRVNRDLAEIAEERGYAFGLGSQRAMHVKENVGSTYKVRDVAPTTLVLGNIGVVQAHAMSTKDIRALADSVGANAMCIHLNPAQELIQSDGDRDFRGGIATYERLVGELGIPVIAKETGCGISRDVGLRLRRAGIRHVDVSGAGGTSWVAVETRRAEERGDVQKQALGAALRNWGVPTGASVALLSPLGFETIIATGGVGTGLDACRALALGASMVGIARPLLRARFTGGKAGALAALDAIEAEMRAVLLLTGCRTPADLRKAPRVVSGQLAQWIEQLGGDVG